MIGLMFFSLGFATFPLTFDLSSVAFFIVLLAGMTTMLAYFLGKKTILVTIMMGVECVLIRDPTRPDLGKLVPSRVVQEDDHKVLADRRGKKMELKRMEFRFANAEDMSRAILIFRRFLPKP